ncbi:LysR family transcriptional regulator [Roseibium sp. SCPC15]|uniref:LysR family transcriptional regulator n=1 Tax=Roseibium sp. SCP15 TaxID=3141376 RepID=UPI0033382FD7
MADLENLSAFVAAAEEGSFSAAARKLGRAQSAISNCIANLEIDLNTQLFSRKGYRPELTDEGRSLLVYAKSVLDSHVRLQSHAEALMHDAEPVLVLSVQNGLMVRRVTALLTKFSQTFPSLQLEIRSGSGADVRADLSDGHADLGLTREFAAVPKSYSRRGLGFQRCVPVCLSSHPLAKLKEVGRSDLARYRQVVCPDDLEPGSGRRLSPGYWSVGDTHRQLTCVLQGLGWAELPVEDVEEGFLAGHLKVLNYDFAQNAILFGVDLLTSNLRKEGAARKWLVESLCGWDQRAWIGDHRIGAR